eukprot:TRINITY_DN68167_c0_g1_i1.p1 TRINITY_DN68167_c0_g1~~TRINITY_DN68167_c0_g1_i1.p1  ORF type:complete len:436 (-),score=87.03 TRINITY_DN68167_c0_g1_i1:120-1427(-)
MGFARDRLDDCLRRLHHHPATKPFLSDVVDTTEYIVDPVNLGIIGDRLIQGCYENINGCVQPALFWADIEKCWENWQRRFDLAAQEGRRHRSASVTLATASGGEAGELCKVPTEMRMVVQAVEDSFWAEVDAAATVVSLHFVGDSADSSLQHRRSPVEMFATAATAKWTEVFEGWCYDSLRRCLWALRANIHAVSFLNPVPWEDLGLHEYPKVVKDPIDLGTIREKIAAGDYGNASGSGGTHFWADVARCWDNCQRYCDYDDKTDAFHAAASMRIAAQSLEASFWADVAKFKMLRGYFDAPHLHGDVEEDRFIHEWCEQQLDRCLDSLSLRLKELLTTEATSSDCPGSEDGTGDSGFLDADVEVVRKRLHAGGYEDEDKLIDPTPFWKDIRKCRSFRGDTVRAQALRAAASELEAEFDAALDHLEEGIAEAARQK